MSKKPNMLVTGRFLDERPPLASKDVPNPFPDPPPNRQSIGRLCFRGPSAKVDYSPSQIADLISSGLLPNAVIFPDTNILTTELDERIWKAMRTKRIFIAPGVWKELLPWLKTPFHNPSIRDDVLKAVRNQVKSREDQPPRGSGADPASYTPALEVVFDDERFRSNAYDYYLRLLSLRKMMGPLAKAVLTKKLGRIPTQDECLAELQGRFGTRGYRMARKGMEADGSPNKLTDEQLVVMAVLTAITTGSEVLILTKDGDLLEQSFKLLALMKEHYRAMHAVERYAENAGAMPFREVPTESGGGQIAPFVGPSVLQLETTDADFSPLPTTFNFVNVNCFVLGGTSPNLKLTSYIFCAEKEMSEMLRVKTVTGGLSTDRLGGKNCTIRTMPLSPTNHKVIVSIGNETPMTFGGHRFGFDDANNVLYENEEHTSRSYDQ